ncbi:MAG: hypothetical protein LH624_18215 [Cryobacterium sp.]|nr:hypothetical protein [Cryobacterium sp.]
MTENSLGCRIASSQNALSWPPERIVLTNYATEPMKERCKALGASGVFDQSAEIEKLLEWLAARVRH